MENMPEKPHLVLVPGLVCDDALWRHQAAALSDIADVTVTDKHTRYPSMKEIAEAIVADSPDRFALAGLSMGGYIALEIMQHWPDRVQRLAVLDSSARADTPEKTENRHQMIKQAESGKFDEIVSSLLPVFIHPDRLQDTALIEKITAMIKRVGADNFIRQQRAIISRRSQVPNLPNIRCPTCVICGKEDTLTPLELAKEIAGSIPGATLHVIDHCGHMTTMERPEAVNAVMREWLIK
jgi:pimeloyl-ACP methyl ester carboxylesterase